MLIRNYSHIMPCLPFHMVTLAISCNRKCRELAVTWTYELKESTLWYHAVANAGVHTILQRLKDTRVTFETLGISYFGNQNRRFLAVRRSTTCPSASGGSLGGSLARPRWRRRDTTGLWFQTSPKLGTHPSHTLPALHVPARVRMRPKGGIEGTSANTVRDLASSRLGDIFEAGWPRTGKR